MRIIAKHKYLIYIPNRVVIEPTSRRTNTRNEGNAIAPVSNRQWLNIAWLPPPPDIRHRITLWKV
jgi:hypothetical protein